jgi:hypothetical protein
VFAPDADPFMPTVRAIAVLDEREKSAAAAVAACPV